MIRGAITLLVTSSCLASFAATEALLGPQSEPILVKAADFARSHVYTWPDNKYGDAAEHIRNSGSLGSLKGEGTRGYLEYDFNIPSEGWYELSSLPENIPFAGLEVTLDGRFYYPLQKEARSLKGNANSLGHFHLAAGKHTLRMEIRSLYMPFKAYTGFQLKEVVPENRLRIETTAPFVNEIVARKGSRMSFRAEYSDSERDSILTVKTIDPKSGKAVAEAKINLPASKAFRSFDFSVPAARDGVFDLKYELDGKALSEKSGPQYSLVTVDATPVACSNADPEAELVQEIDSVKTEPDYAKGPSKIVTSKAGTFRESSRSSGWDKNPPEWFAYKFAVPEPEALYKFEFVYPDDSARASHFAVRQDQKHTGYAKVLGVNTGGEFRNSGRMLTGVLYTWIYGEGGRIVIIPGGNKMPAAVSKIRISKVKGNTLAPLSHAKEETRRLQYFYEEAASVVGMETGQRFENQGKDDPELMLHAFDRYCAQTAFMGATEHLFAAEVYGGGFWPSRYEPCRWTRPFRADNVAKLLLTAEKYGQNCVFDFHASPMDFHPAEGELYKPENRQVSASGSSSAWNDLKFLINPIHPDTAKWRNGMLADFANRYKDYPNFKGVRIRNMGWQDNGWARFHGLDWGYDDYTVGRFEAETGIKVPVDAADKGKYGKRSAFLLGQKKKEWMEWRAQKVTELYLQARDTIRKIRPDLELYCNLDSVEDKDYEAGIDAKALRLNGISVSYRTFTGRNPIRSSPAAKMRIQSLSQFDQPDDPPQAERAMHHWLVYYEGPEIARNEEIGLPKDPINWWGYAAWPAGRNELEFWALALARRDASLLLTGTIGYGFGTPIMREFLDEFSRLPSHKFATLAKDPVAIRSYDRWFYSVNSLPVPVKVSIELDGSFLRKGHAYRMTDGSEFDVSSFELQPFQLMAFTTDSKIKSFSVTPPESYVDELRAIAAPAIAAAKEIPELKEAGDKLVESIGKGELCTARLLLEINRPLFEQSGVALPGLYNAGAPEVPEGALVKPEKPTESIPAKSLFPNWDAEKFLAGKSVAFALESPVSGEYLPRIGYVGGGGLREDRSPAGRKAEGRNDKQRRSSVLRNGLNAPTLPGRGGETHAGTALKGRKRHRRLLCRSDASDAPDSLPLFPVGGTPSDRSDRKNDPRGTGKNRSPATLTEPFSAATPTGSAPPRIPIRKSMGCILAAARKGTSAAPSPTSTARHPRKSSSWWAPTITGV